VLAGEKTELLDFVKTIPGVTEVRDRLDSHERTGQTTSPQGANSRLYGPVRELQESGTPAVRAMSTLGGEMFGYLGTIGRSPIAPMLAVAALGFLARSLKSANANQMFGVSGNAQMVDIEKTIKIKASPETVFDIWSRYENFPYFMSHVEEVRDLGSRRSHWVVKGPAGIDMEWNSVLIESARPSFLAWKSEPGSIIENTGSVRLEPTGNGTRATVRMSYSPPAGALGEGVASLLGSDPEQELEEGLIQMRNFIESGKRSSDAAKAESASGQILH
jgi:uncharacterized membrane protein